MFILFKAGLVDYTSKIIEGSYKVYQENITYDWEDGNYKKHKEILRTKTSGSFQIKLSSWSAYTTFISTLNGVKVGSEYTLTVFAQNTNTSVTSKFFLTLPPELRQKSDLTFTPGTFTITIEEA